MAASIRLLVCFLAFMGLALAQDRSEPQPEKPVELKVSTTAMMLCLGASMPMEMELTNRSGQEFKVDKVDLWNSFSYGHSRDDGSGRGGGQATGCSHCRGEYIVLVPEQKHVSTFNFALASDFFKDPGNYTIKLNYKQVSSNELHFELYDCNPK